MSLRVRRGWAAIVALLLLGTAAALLAAAEPTRAADAAAPATVAADAIKKGAKVTVSQATDLGFQSVHVSWTGFPVNGNFASVRIYECKGSAPTSVAACYGEDGGANAGPLSGFGGAGPDGPGNRVTAITAKDGTGGADFVVYTGQQLSSLGCSTTSACSMLVLYHAGGFVNDSDPTLFGPHAVIPLTFKPGLEGCPLNDPDFSVEGAPAANLAMLSWTAKACLGTPRDVVAYTLLSDATARSDFQAGSTDVALTTRGLGAPTKHAIAYAPLAVNGITVGVNLDDPVTHKQLNGVKLDARLVAKLITQSYPAWGQDHTAPTTVTVDGKTTACDYTKNISVVQDALCQDPNTAGNPSSIFQDPEFQDLNKDLDVDWSAYNPYIDWTQPIMAGDPEDLTYELTRWLVSDPAAKAFLTGTKDPYGMHVNNAFLADWKAGTYTFPSDSFRAVDPSNSMTYEFALQAGLDAVVRQVAANQPAGRDVSKTPNIAGSSIPAYLDQNVGARRLFAIFDTGDASNVSMQPALLENAAGKFVGPTADALTAAVGDMTKNADGTEQADVTSTDPAAYPLPIIHYAAVPTSGVATAKAGKIADFVHLAAVDGQTVGVDNGDLPAGYLPLTADLQSQATAAEAAVRSQTGKLPATTPAPTPSLRAPGGNGLAGGTGAGGSGGLGGDTGSGSGDTGTGADGGTGGLGDGDTGSGSGGTGGGNSGTASPVDAKGTPSPTGTSVAGPARLAGERDSTGIGHWALPVLLAVGLVASALGPGVIVLARGGEMPDWMRRARRAVFRR